MNNSHPANQIKRPTYMNTDPNTDIEQLIYRIRMMRPYRSDDLIAQKLIEEEGKEAGFVFLCLMAAKILDQKQEDNDNS